MLDKILCHLSSSAEESIQSSANREKRLRKLNQRKVHKTTATRCCQRGQGESECCRSRNELADENEADICAWSLYLPLLVLSKVYCQ